MHYENLPMQYTYIFSAAKIKDFTRQRLSQNIDCGYTLEPPSRVWDKRVGDRRGIERGFDQSFATAVRPVLFYIGKKGREMKR